MPDLDTRSSEPALRTIVPGTRTVAQLDQNLAWIEHPIPAAYWSDLKGQGLVREDAPTP